MTDHRDRNGAPGFPHALKALMAHAKTPASRVHFLEETLLTIALACANLRQRASTVSNHDLWEFVEEIALFASRAVEGS